MADFNVGDRVRAKEAIYEPADDYAPGGYLCSKGDLLIVRKVDGKLIYPVSVSHESVTDRSFGVKPEEIEADGSTVSDGVASTSIASPETSNSKQENDHG